MRKLKIRDLLDCQATTQKLINHVEKREDSVTEGAVTLTREDIKGVLNALYSYIDLLNALLDSAEVTI